MKKIKQPKNLQNNVNPLTIQVHLPKDEDRYTINRTANFVGKYGMVFENIVINNQRKHSKKQFAFLFDVESKDHAYYRWKIWSLLMGDSATNWSIKPFRMIENGYIYLIMHLPFLKKNK